MKNSFTATTSLPLSEEQEQRALVEWARLSLGRFPDLHLLFHIPNGGLRHPVTAQKMKLAGAKSGVPDLMLPVPRRGFHGLFIEMKRTDRKPTGRVPAPKGALSDTQVWWVGELRLNGYRVEVCYGFEAARQVLEEYLS